MVISAAMPVADASDAGVRGLTPAAWSAHLASQRARTTCQRRFCARPDAGFRSTEFAVRAPGFQVADQLSGLCGVIECRRAGDRHCTNAGNAGRSRFRNCTDRVRVHRDHGFRLFAVQVVLPGDARCPGDHKRVAPAAKTNPPWKMFRMR